AVLGWTQEELLEHRVRNAVLDDDLAAHVARRLGFGDRPVAELLVRQLVAPIAERALGELHDVALMDERDRQPAALERVTDRRADQPPRAALAHPLDPDRAPLPDPRP